MLPAIAGCLLLHYELYHSFSHYIVVMAVALSNIFSCINLSFPQGRNVQNGNFSFSIYLSYLVYAPLYIAGPILSFNAFASQVC